MSGGSSAAVALTLTLGALLAAGQHRISTPGVVGRDSTAAQGRLATAGAGAGLDVAYRLVHDASATGLVIAQSVAPGTRVTAGTTVTLTVSIGPAAFPGAAACTARSLRPGPGPGPSEMTGQHTVDVSLTNTSASTCVLSGYPAVTVLDGRRKPLPFSYSRRGDEMTTGAAPARVYLTPGSRAWVRLNKYRCDLRATDRSAAVRLRLPAAAGTISVPTTEFQYCRAAPSSTVAVSPFEPLELLLAPRALLTNVLR